MVITFYDSYSILNKVYKDGAFLKQAMLDTPIRETSRPLTTKICYGVLDKDLTLNYVLSKLCNKMPKQSIKTILKIGLYCIIYLNTAPYAVTDACVELIKKLGKGGTAGFVNAVLRNYVRNGVGFNEKGNLGLSIKYSYPLFAVELLVKDYGLATAKKIMEDYEEKSYLRFNNDIDGETYLKNNGYDYVKTPFNNCFEVKNAKMNEDFYNGVYTFQSIGSVAICETVKGGGTLLDTCSAPGGKAVNLSDKFNSVVACELHSHRVELIKSYASRMKKQNILAVNCDSSVYNSEYDSAFDVVLCDAPCSGMGVVKDNPDIKLRRDKNGIIELTKLQLSILNNVAKYVKKGGLLYYSTCSVLKMENDGVAERFLKENDNFVLCEISSPLKSLKCNYGLQFLPYISSGAGFFVTCFKKV